MPNAFERVRAAYREVATYRDRGEVTCELRGKRRTARFMTRYLAPHHFRFDAEDADYGRIVIASDGKGARWLTGQGGEFYRSTDIRTALLEMPERDPALWLSPAFQALSLIPPLLLPTKGWRGRLRMVQGWIAGRRVILVGRPCLEISGTQHIDAGADLQPISEWIGQQTSEPQAQASGLSVVATVPKILVVWVLIDESDQLIRRFVADDETVHYWPEVDVPMSPAEFVF